MGSRRALVALIAATLLAPACGTRADRAAFYRALEASGSERTTTSGQSPTDDTDAATQTAPTRSREAARAGAGATPRSASSTRSSVLSDERVGDTIRVGLHIPITGAAPLPTGFRDYMRVVEEYVAKEARIAGRKFVFVESDDGYDPAKGQAACRKLAEQNVTFVVGHTMPAVQDGCAELFGSRGIPYLMRGTYPQVVQNRPYAYFGTISDDRQGRLLADYALNRLNGRSRKAAVVYQNDQTASRDAFVARMKQDGGSIVAQEQSVPRQPDYAATVQKLQQAGAEIVFLSMPPVDAIKLSVQSQGQGYHPQWLGGATYWNYNLTLESAGRALDGAIVFSPWASIDAAAANGFREVYRRYRPDREPEDIGLIIWGWYGLVRSALERAGTNLSRASFVDALNTLDFSAEYWNPVRYTATDHMGPKAVAVFRADGQAKRWRQIEGFTSEFGR